MCVFVCLLCITVSYNKQLFSFLSTADEQLSRNAASAISSVGVGVVETRPLGDGSSAGAAAKNFVGVSQVFNSLNDYSNNVKSLATEIESHDSYDWTAEAEADAKAAEQAAQREMASIHAIELDDDEHEDIKKFSEAQAKQSKATADGITVSSSESLTTSSCSTFSSGPSPGNVSNSDEEDEAEQQQQLVPEQQAGDKADNDTEESASVTEPAPSQPKLEQKQQQLEDLAVGLSSISITTESQSILPCEVTASSALDRVLNELSEETSTELEMQSQPQPAAATAVVSSKVMGGKLNFINPNIQFHQEPAPTLVAAAQQQPKPEQLPQARTEEQVAVPKRSQPLTFCSTMDEISDTELDSMLQEVEVDIEEQQQQHERELQQPVGGTETMVIQQPQHEMIDDDEDAATASPATEEESVRILSEQETTSADQMNVDNFSQASTVEFAELRPHEVAPVAEETPNSFSSSASDTDSLSGRKLDEDEEQEQENEAEGDDSIAADALETQDQRPQRPQTLNLNGSCPTLAGQTPPPPEAQTENEIQVEREELPEGASAPPPAAGEGETEDDDSPIYEAVGYSDPHANLGKVPPIWVPDNMAGQCMQCQQKFTMIKRRHHCRACGKVLCSVCCSQRFHLQFVNEPESRVCVQCFMILTERQANGGVSDVYAGTVPAALPPTPMRSPNPNNPMEYCSTIPPHRQVAVTPQPPSVIVPVGVLKKTDGSSSNSSSSDGKKGRKRKSVMFSDGIAPGSELAVAMEQQWGEAKHARRGVQRSNSGAGQKPPTPGASGTGASNGGSTSSSSGSSIDNSTTMGLVAQLFRGSIPPSAAAATLAAVGHGSREESSGE